MAFSKFIPKFVQDFIGLTDNKSESYIFDRFWTMLAGEATFNNKKGIIMGRWLLDDMDEKTLELTKYNQH